MPKNAAGTPAAQARAQDKGSAAIAVGAGVIVVAALLGGLYLLSHRSQPPAPPAPSEEALAYLSQLSVSDLHLSAEGNFLGQDVVYVDGKIINRGDRTVKQLRLRLYFYDSLSQVVLREEQDVIGPRSAPLGPGQTREFQLRFDRLPPSWNLQPPQFQLVSLEIQ